MLSLNDFSSKVVRFYDAVYDNKAAKLRSQQRSCCSKGTGDACHFVTGAFLAFCPRIVEQSISRGISGNRKPSGCTYGRKNGVTEVTPLSENTQFS